MRNIKERKNITYSIKKAHLVRFRVLTEASIKIIVFYNITQCSLVEID
jgi:hypothetical protein